MTRRARPAPCSCPNCAQLDLAYPGEGVQLALPALAAVPRRRRANRTGERQCA